MVDAYGRHFPDYPGQQPYQDPQYMRWMHQQAQQIQQPQMQQPAPQQMMTPPTIHAEIIQVDGEAEAERWPVNTGASQMFMTRDDSAIIIKTMSAAGPLPLVVYERRAPAPQEPVFDPAAYVRRDELPSLIAAAISQMTKEEQNEPIRQSSRAAKTASEPS